MESNKKAQDFFGVRTSDFCLFGINTDYFKSPFVQRIRKEYPELEAEFQLIDWVIFPPPKGGDKVMMLGKLVDKDTELSKGFHQIANHMPGSLYWKDKNGCYLGCNDFMVKTAGLSSTADIVGKTDAELWPGSADEIRRNDLRIMEAGEMESLEEEVVLASGEKMYFAGMKLPLKNSREEVVGVICNSLEITKIKEAKDNLERLNQLKTEFIRNMEHDIRTPFSGIYSMALLLSEAEEDPIKRECLEDITNSAKELLDYCNNVIAFSRIDSGNVPHERVQFNLKELVGSVIFIHTPSAKSKKIRIEFNYDASLTQLFIGDFNRIKCILLNLVGNSIKFTDQGGVMLSVAKARGGSLSDKLVYVEIKVEDSGIGIPASEQGRVFEKFVRLTQSNRGIFTGQGLGLSIVKKFVEELSGKTHLESEEGVGTKFTVTLPLVIFE